MLQHRNTRVPADTVVTVSFQQLTIIKLQRVTQVGTTTTQSSRRHAYPRSFRRGTNPVIAWALFPRFDTSNLARPCEDRIQHVRRQTSGECVLLTRVIGPNHRVNSS